jgi:hypothetical protein
MGKARTCYGGSRERLHIALRAARGQIAVVVARVAQGDRWGVVAAWAGRLKRVDMPQLSLSEVQPAGMNSPGGRYRDRRLGPGALEPVGVMENVSGQAQKPEQSVGFGIPRGSACVAAQIRC